MTIVFRSSHAQTGQPSGRVPVASLPRGQPIPHAGHDAGRVRTGFFGARFVGGDGALAGAGLVRTGLLGAGLLGVVGGDGGPGVRIGTAGTGVTISASIGIAPVGAAAAGAAAS